MYCVFFACVCMQTCLYLCSGSVSSVRQQQKSSLADTMWMCEIKRMCPTSHTSLALCTCLSSCLSHFSSVSRLECVLIFITSFLISSPLLSLSCPLSLCPPPSSHFDLLPYTTRSFIYCSQLLDQFSFSLCRLFFPFFILRLYLNSLIYVPCCPIFSLLFCKYITALHEVVLVPIVLVFLLNSHVLCSVIPGENSTSCTYLSFN